MGISHDRDTRGPLINRGSHPISPGGPYPKWMARGNLSRARVAPLRGVLPLPVTKIRTFRANLKNDFIILVRTVGQTVTVFITGVSDRSPESLYNGTPCILYSSSGNQTGTIAKFQNTRFIKLNFRTRTPKITSAAFLTVITFAS